MNDNFTAVGEIEVVEIDDEIWNMKSDQKIRLSRNRTESDSKSS